MRRDPIPSPEEVTRVLDALQSDPAPTGMAQRAVAQWLDDTAPAQAPERAHRPRPAWGLFALRPLAAALATVAILAVVRQRIGEDPHTASAPEPTGAARTEGKASRAVADPEDAHESSGGGALPSAARREPRPPVGGSAGAAASRPVVEQIARRAAASDAPHTRTTVPYAMAGGSAPTSVRLRAGVDTTLVGSSADLAYINGETPRQADAARADDGVADTRLLSTVTLAAEDDGLPDLLGQLRVATGVSISVTDSLARRPIAVACQSVPLRDVLRQMARSLALRWERSGAGETSRYVASGPTAPAPAEAEAFGKGADLVQAPAAFGGGRADPRAARRAGYGQSSVIGEPELVRAYLAGHDVGGRVRSIEGWVVVGDP